MGVNGKHHTPVALPTELTPVRIVQKDGWDPEPVWTGTENITTTGIRSSNLWPVASRYTDYEISYLHLRIRGMVLYDQFDYVFTI